MDWRAISGLIVVLLRGRVRRQNRKAECNKINIYLTPQMLECILLCTLANGIFHGAEA
jgi:hypothetical protein